MNPVIPPLSPLALGKQEVTPHAVEIKPKLPVPQASLGLAIVDLAHRIDFSNSRYVHVATKVCHTLLENLKSFNTEHLKKLEERASFLQSAGWWSSITTMCSLVASALALFAGLSSSDPATSVMAIGLALLPFIYEALSSPLEQKNIEKGVIQAGSLLATAFFFNSVRTHLPALTSSALNPALTLIQGVTGLIKNMHETRLTWKSGELEALEFLTTTLQTELQQTSGSMTDHVNAVSAHTASLTSILDKYIHTTQAFI